MNKKTVIKNVIIIVLAVFVLAGAFLTIFYKVKLDGRKEEFDAVFLSNFQALSNNIWIQGVTDAELEDKLGDTTIKYAAVCDAVFDRTTYSDSDYGNELRSMISRLLELAKRRELNSEMGAEIMGDIQHLSMNFEYLDDYGDLIDSINTSLSAMVNQ